MESFLMFFAYALILLIVCKAVFQQRLPWGALALTAGGAMLFCALASVGGVAMQTSDTEILNGQVSAKTSDQVSCAHSYSCNCREECTTNSDGSKSCSQVCETCYDHLYDIDWNLHTTVGQIEISRVDRQGVDVPPRWERARIGDPVAVLHTYTNYIKAAKNSLHHKGGPVQSSLATPPYPSDVYDYHYLRRAIAVGVPGIDIAWWDEAIANSLRDLGAERQVNFIVIFAGTGDQNYATAIEHAWLGGKKNDVVVVIGVPKAPAIEWVRVISWTDRQDFKVKLRDDILAAGSVLEKERIMNSIVSNTKKSFLRKQMEDFKYLRYEIELPGWYIALVLALLTAGCVIACRHLADGPVARVSWRPKPRW